jgi:hypothetical protein
VLAAHALSCRLRKCCCGYDLKREIKRQPLYYGLARLHRIHVAAALKELFEKEQG